MGSYDAIVVGAGAFGASAAIALAGRSMHVALIDPGPIPHPLASSTDINKLVRLEYGADVFYTELMERALARWRASPLFHETGLAILSSGPMARGSFELESFELLRARGHALERLDAIAIAARFPAWAPGRYADGFHDPQGGWAESGRVVASLVAEATAARVEVHEGARVLALVDGGVRTGEGELLAPAVVVAAGAWTPWLLPELAPKVRIVGQPVLCFAPRDPAPFAAPAFLPFAADVSRTGWYGFCADSQGVVKIANHGAGVPIDPHAMRPVPADAEPCFRAFLRESIPGLADAPLASARLCLYCDSVDGDPWIARVPGRRGVVVASGGSGHGFKLAPVLGDLVADAVAGEPPHPRFGWREPGAARFEAARFADRS